MATRLLTPEQSLEILSTTPDRIAAVTKGVKPALLRQPPSPGEWSAVEVLAHIRACEDQWGGSIRRILAEETMFEAMNPLTWMKRTDYPQQPFARSFAAFASQRAALLATLRSLDGDGWRAQAEVKVWGQVLVRSVFSYTERLAHHERAHVKQIEKTVRAVLAASA